MSDLVSRLYAAIGEKEHLANRARVSVAHRDNPVRSGQWSDSGRLFADGVLIARGPDGDDIDVNVSTHIVDNDPAALLRMCQAHRKILGEYRIAKRHWDETEKTFSSRAVLVVETELNLLRVVVAILAEGYDITTEEGE